MTKNQKLKKLQNDISTCANWLKGLAAQVEALTEDASTPPTATRANRKVERVGGYMAALGTGSYRKPQKARK